MQRVLCEGWGWRVRVRSGLEVLYARCASCGRRRRGKMKRTKILGTRIRSGFRILRIRRVSRCPSLHNLYPNHLNPSPNHLSPYPPHPNLNPNLSLLFPSLLTIRPSSLASRCLQRPCLHTQCLPCHKPKPKLKPKPHPQCPLPSPHSLHPHRHHHHQQQQRHGH